MKKLITTIVLLVFITTTVNAQIKKPRVKIPRNTPFSNIDPNLNLEKIKIHLKSGAHCYGFNLATTAIVPPKTGGVRLVPIIGYLSTNRIAERSEQLVISGSLLKNTNRYLGRDSYTVFLAPDNRDAKKINKLGVFITWRLAGENLRTFQLRNVAIEYKPYGILIIGDYEVDGVLIAMSMTLSPKPCLI